MKKFLFFPLAIWLLTACNSSTQDDRQDDTDTFALHTNIKIFQFDKEEIKSNPEKAKINARLTEAVEEHEKQMRKDLSEALTDTEFPSKNLQFELWGETKIYINNEKFFSAKNKIYSYYGGAHGNAEELGYNFEISGNTAREITYTELFSSEKNWKRELTLLAIRAVHKKLGTKDTSLISIKEIEESEDPFSFLGDFVITKENFVVIFPKYSIACGASGVLTAELPYPEIAHLLTPFAQNLLKNILEK